MCGSEYKFAVPVNSSFLEKCIQSIADRASGQWSIIKNKKYWYNIQQYKQTICLLIWYLYAILTTFVCGLVGLGKIVLWIMNAYLDPNYSQTVIFCNGILRKLNIMII